MKDQLARFRALLGSRRNRWVLTVALLSLCAGGGTMIWYSFGEDTTEASYSTIARAPEGAVEELVVQEGRAHLAPLSRGRS